MRIGVVSDTHNNIRNVTRIVELFNEVAVDLVVHTGDITQAKTLEVFANLEMAMIGVFGNNDQEREALDAAIHRFGFEFQEPPLEVTWAGRNIVVVHDPLELDGVLAKHHSLALHGHTHFQRIETTATGLVFNPGECAGHIKGCNAIGVVDLRTLEPSILNF